MPRRGDWIQTFTGRQFWPLDPRPEEIVIEDIAHALSMQCRFTGHCRDFYSVGEHSYWVSKLCKPENALWGLLHDASEAYLQDMAKPIKRLPEMQGYRDVEKIAQETICLRFGLAMARPDDVSLADKQMLAIEARDLLGPLHPEFSKWLRDYVPDRPLNVVMPMTQREAERNFLVRFRELEPRII